MGKNELPHPKHRVAGTPTSPADRERLAERFAQREAAAPAPAEEPTEKLESDGVADAYARVVMELESSGKALDALGETIARMPAPIKEELMEELEDKALEASAKPQDVVDGDYIAQRIEERDDAQPDPVE